MFELSYEPWDANGLRISEVKRITLDAGQQFNRFESSYTIYAVPASCSTPSASGRTRGAT